MSEKPAASVALFAFAAGLSLGSAVAFVTGQETVWGLQMAAIAIFLAAFVWEMLV